MQFHASGLNVAHAEIGEATAGHFELVAERAGQPSERIVFGNGATEAWLQPPSGDYVLRLQFVRNAMPHEVMAASEPVNVKIVP